LYTWPHAAGSFSVHVCALIVMFNLRPDDSVDIS